MTRNCDVSFYPTWQLSVLCWTIERGLLIAAGVLHSWLWIYVIAGTLPLGPISDDLVVWIARKFGVSGENRWIGTKRKLSRRERWRLIREGRSKNGVSAE
ncbi:MAG: hypothetical protein AAF662_01525 [Pseudomonadota bacterium]